MENQYSWQERPNVRTFILEAIPPFLGTVGIVAALLIPMWQSAGAAGDVCAPSWGRQADTAPAGGELAREPTGPSGNEALFGYGPSRPLDNLHYLGELFTRR